MFKDDWDSTKDAQGNILIDRSPEYFGVILNYLRTGVLVVDEGMNPLGIFHEVNNYRYNHLCLRPNSLGLLNFRRN